MTSVLTITLNPAVDLDTSTAEIRPGPKLRCSTPRLDPGGGGLNVSRAMAELGGESLALVAAGGGMGVVLAKLLAGTGLPVRIIEAPGETRQSVAVIEDGTGKQFRFIFPGPHWSEGDIAKAESEIAEVIPVGGLVVLSGSHPPGFPDDFPARLVALCSKFDARLILDTSGAALRALQAGRIAGLDVLRLDHEEAEELAARSLPTAKDSADFAQSLVRNGVARVVVLARGADGSILATDRDRWLSHAADVPVRSKTGAGDSFVAGFTLALSQGAALPDCLQRGMAAASAAVMTEATRLCERSDAERLIAVCPVERI
ncbi:1-phosphofructokinase family hexose kinase [Nioella ostreopsis]|uniref:1-phosphofructokinase family hexose kinase n=1 Tax=Nioella ostreopsis TaxID=2448479 RepID=UPI000FDAF9C9|nr:1-phosphofructokinase family hexose kinase [Nioella ostreopsis]